MKWFFTVVFFILSTTCTKKQQTSNSHISFTPEDEKDTSIWNTSQSDFYKQKLSKGINLSNWFNNYSDKGQFGNRFTSINFQQIKNLGFTHVRLPIAWEILFQENRPSELNPLNISFVDDALKNLTNAGLAVIIDPLHGGDEKVELQMATNDNYVSKIALYWKAIVKRYRYLYKPDQLFFEVMNEPHINTNNLFSEGWWPKVQQSIIDSIRAVDQHHYIIAGGGVWNSIYGLKKLIPYNNIKIIYNFHFYDNMVFTHQGATWAGDLFTKLSGVPYPSSPSAVDSLVKITNDPIVKNALIMYGNENWNQQKMDSIMKDISNWALSNHIDYLTCNEFGSYKPKAPLQSRLNWIHDVHSSLEKYKIGWTMWEYDEGFGLITYPSGNRNIPVIDSALVVSLGL